MPGYGPAKQHAATGSYLCTAPSLFAPGTNFAYLTLLPNTSDSALPLWLYCVAKEEKESSSLISLNSLAKASVTALFIASAVVQ